MTKKIILWLLFFLIGFFIFFFIWNFNSKDDWKVSILYYNQFDNKHLGKDIKDVLNNENYSKIWINPNDFKTFEDFLIYFKDLDWIEFDPLEQKFVASTKSLSGNTIYIPFDFSKNPNLFNQVQDKNLAILDIYNSYNNNLIYWGAWYKNWKNIIFEKDMEHKLTDELNKIFSSSVNVFDYIETLEKAEFIWQENTELLSYLYDLTWLYDKASEQRTIICEKYWDCDSILDIKVKINVKDSNWNNIKWTKVELLNNNDTYLTDSNWEIDINFPFSSFSHLRFKASKLGYSDGFVSYSLNEYLSPTWKKEFTLDFKLEKSSDVVIVNNSNLKDFQKWKYILIETLLSKYFIPKDNLYLEDFITKYNFNEDSELIIYLYHFKKSSNMDNLLENDTFDPVYWYVWNIMKTFWMPYIQIVDWNTWKELYVKSDNPMVLQNQIYHMKELYDNYDWIYSEITDEDMAFLLDYSNNSDIDYPIDFDFLTSNNILRWPAWWVLDRKTWVWSNVGHVLLDINWKVELPFYHFD